MRTIHVLILALCLPALLAACSMAGFAYDLAPRLAVRYADDYLQLNSRQEAHALKVFRERHRLHARDELPRYYRFLGEVHERTIDGLTRGEIDSIFNEGRELYRLAVRRTLPALAEILAGLEPAQLDALEKRLARDAEKDRKRMNEDGRARRLEKTLEDVEEWLGVVEDEQLQLIKSNLAEMHDTRPLWLQWRIDNGERFIAFMREEPSTAEIEEFLADYWLERKGLPETLEQQLDENMNRYREMLVQLDGTLGDGQRRHALGRVGEFREMIVDIMPDAVREAVLSATGGGIGEQAER